MNGWVGAIGLLEYVYDRNSTILGGRQVGVLYYYPRVFLQAEHLGIVDINLSWLFQNVQLSPTVHGFACDSNRYSFYSLDSYSR